MIVKLTMWSTPRRNTDSCALGQRWPSCTIQTKGAIMASLCLELLRCRGNLAIGTIFKDRWAIDRSDENCTVDTTKDLHFWRMVQQVDMTIRTILYRHSLTTDLKKSHVKYVLKSFYSLIEWSYPSIEPGGLINRELTTPEMTTCWGDDNPSSIMYGTTSVLK